MSLIQRVVAVLTVAAWLFGGAYACAGEAGNLPVAQQRAFELLNAAQSRQLSDRLADEAAAALTANAPFVRGLAEWAIATRVEGDNRGPKLVWPAATAPAWFERWQQLPPHSLLELDYVRQAVQTGIYRDVEALKRSADGIIARAKDVAALGNGAASEPARKAIDALSALRRDMDRGPATLADCQRLWLAMRRTARAVALAQPGAEIASLLFVKLHPGHSLQNITGACYPWTHKPGGGICIQAGLTPGDACRELLAARLGPGHVHGIDLSWNADRVVFGYARQPAWPPRHNTESGSMSFELRKEQPPTRLFEMRLDGSGLRQLGEDCPWNDFEPTYTAADDVVFASDRSGRSSECGMFSADHTVVNLYRYSADGKDLRRLNDNKDIDRYPHSLDNGLIAYTHWEYQERHFMEVHAAWSIRPDGTGADVLANQHRGAPYGLRDIRSVPQGALVAVATGHHTLAYGPLVLVRPERGPNHATSIVSITPEVKPQEGPPPARTVAEGGVRDGGGVWQTPWALSEKCFLAAYTYGPVKAGQPAGSFAIYLVDVFGNKELLHRDPLISCTYPMPVRPRQRPPVMPDRSDPSQGYATAYVADVYRGLDGVQRGTVKSLRIMQHVGWPLTLDAGAHRWIPGNAWEPRFGFWSWSPTRVIGTVPVAEDGSAWFKTPANTAVYFQALDERGLEVRRMRSNVTFQPGEVRGCVGCHETRSAAVASLAPLRGAAAAQDLVGMGEPHTPAPPPWGDDTLLDYERHVQPLLDRHCVRCHGQESPQGGVEFTARRAPDGFLQSFRTMFGLKWADETPFGKSGALLRKMAVNEAPGQLVAISDRFSGSSVTRPRQFGSAKSRLILALADTNHRSEVALGPDDWITLVTWVDANAPYYGTYLKKRDDSGRPLVSPVRVGFDLGLPFGSVPANP